MLQVLQVLHETQMLRHSSAELLELWEPKEPKESKESTAQEQLTLLTPLQPQASIPQTALQPHSRSVSSRPTDPPPNPLREIWKQWAVGQPLL